jgi:hypothetical protein
MRRVNGLFALLLLVFLAGCGGESDNGVADLSADAALDRVKTAVEDVKSVHVVGSIDQEGQTLDIDMHTARDKGQGTLTFDGGEMELRLVDGTTYVKAEASTFEKLQVPAAQAALIGGKWLKSGGASGQFSSFGQFLDLDQLFESLLKPEGELEKGDTTEIEGDPAIALIDNAETGGTLYVATTGDPIPLRITKSGTGGGQVDFTEYDADVTVTVPDGAIDISQFGG